MPQKRRPMRGSHAYGPRKRAQSQTPRFDSWPEIPGGPKIQGFAGYKAGMTHAFVTDKRAGTTTSGMELQVPVTVIESPPMKIAAVRLYENTVYGLRTLGEIWAQNLDPLLSRRFTLPKSHSDDLLSKYNDMDIEDVRVIAYTQPKMVTGVPKKVPDIMELRIGGGSISERITYAESILGNDITINDFAGEGTLVDVIAVTKGKGFQGVTKRWGVKLLSHKNSKHRRGIANLGPKRPGYVRGTVPGSGQMGYHQRTEFNKQLMKIGTDGSEITPKGGFLCYGNVVSNYVLIHGSVPGPVKRLIRFRDAVRVPKMASTKMTEIAFISKQSKQGA